MRGSVRLRAGNLSDADFVGASSPFRGAKGDVLASEAPLKGELAAAG